MKKAILLTALIALSALPLVGQSLVLPLGDLDLVVYGAKSEDFRLGSSGDTILIQPLEQAPLDSAYLIPRQEVELLTVEERLTVDFLQETLDYEPAFALGTPHEYRLETEGGNVYQLRTLEEFSPDPQHIKRAEAASRKAQTEYYEHFLATKEEQPELHPEYILEAEHFLKKRKTLPFDELRTTPTITERLVLVRYREAGSVRQLILRELAPSDTPLEGEAVIGYH